MSSRTPLLPGRRDSSDHHHHHQPSSPIATGIVHALAWLRVITGGMALLAPSFTAKVFCFSPGIITSTSGSSSLTNYQLRLFGIRDLVIGELLYVVRPRFSSSSDTSCLSDTEMNTKAKQARQELRRVLWVNIATDALDVVVTGAAVATGAIPKPAASVVGGGAATFFMMGLVGLKTM